MCEFRVATFSSRYILPGNQSAEHLARKRRVGLFKAATLLREFDTGFTSELPPVLLDVPGKWQDHQTLWELNGILFSLAEPYHPDAPQTDRLVYIEIPTPLAPYCGRYSAEPSAIPWTRSWLFSEPEHEEKLHEIDQRLERAAKTAPPWNKV